MTTESFIDWLTNEKKMNNRSAKDVVSRCKRVQKISGCTKINFQTKEKLENKPTFLVCSFYIKSQLRRSISLYLEFLLQLEGIYHV